MTLVYRAVWEDEWCDPPAVLNDEFISWCASKGVEPDDIPYRGVLIPSERLSIEVRRADAETGRALRCILAETDNRGRRWTTTATALVDTESRLFWVDLECDDPSRGQPEMAAPRLVRGLISSGGRPTLFGVQLQEKAHRLGPDSVSELIDVLLDEHRKVPIVVFSPEPGADPPVTIGRADAAAGALAGLALVYVLSPQAETLLNEAVPVGFGIYGGAVRLYLPPLRPDDPDDPYRHRWIPLRLIASHPRRAAAMLAGRLARLQLHQPIPHAWSSLSAMLRRPTEAEVDLRASAITNARSAGMQDADVSTLVREIDELTKLLAEADLLREAVERRASDEVARLSELVAIAEIERYDDADELEDLRHERDELQRALWITHKPSAPDRGDMLDTSPRSLAVPTSIADALELARTRLDLVCIAPNAARDIDELDATPKYKVWASSVWQGLLALQDYASAKSAGQKPPGFKLWCETTSAWPPAKLAMTESTTVTKNDDFREQRNFPISTDVDPSGRRVMFSHLKIQQGGGDNIPRLYFYDDTDGKTGQMHVGFIGPHRHVRNTRS